jgi:hypothetical protein
MEPMDREPRRRYHGDKPSLVRVEMILICFD